VVQTLKNAGRRRVVITGMGWITPLGDDIESVWQRLLKGDSGISPTELFDASTFPTTFSAQVKGFKLDKYLGPTPNGIAPAAATRNSHSVRRRSRGNRRGSTSSPRERIPAVAVVSTRRGRASTSAAARGRLISRTSSRRRSAVG